ncbi:MAG: HNH endonuclease [Candidatus Bathyarchaeota archaeon]|nr:HNH endonuclease [Candidatus Bathyarchaeota archaeon]
MNKKGLFGTDEGLYIYYTNENITKDSLRECFKDFEKFRENDGYDSKGIFFCTKSCDKKLFRDLKQAMIKDSGVRNSIKLLRVEEEAPNTITPKETKSERDSRRAFTQTQKNEILYQQDYKCAECHKKLDLRATEFDHKRPWASGGRTVVINGRALCASCHKIASHNHRLKQIDK